MHEMKANALCNHDLYWPSESAKFEQCSPVRRKWFTADHLTSGQWDSSAL